MAGISKTAFYRWLQSGEVSGVLPVIKRAAFTRRIPISPRNACRVAGISLFVTGFRSARRRSRGRFLEFLESLKGAGAARS